MRYFELCDVLFGPRTNAVALGDLEFDSLGGIIRPESLGNAEIEPAAKCLQPRAGSIRLFGVE
jgi:hypothetical protein